MTFTSARNGTPPTWHLVGSLEKPLEDPAKVECGDDCPYCGAWEKVYQDWEEKISAEADEPVTFEDAFNRIFDESFEILVTKQEAYGPKNIQELDFFGTFSRLASDKINRLKNLMKGEVVNGTVFVQFPLDLEETVEDTLFDIMNYAAILVSLRRGWWGKPLSKDVSFDGKGE